MAARMPALSISCPSLVRLHFQVRSRCRLRSQVQPQGRLLRLGRHRWRHQPPRLQVAHRAACERTRHPGPAASSAACARTALLALLPKRKRRCPALHPVCPGPSPGPQSCTPRRLLQLLEVLWSCAHLREWRPARVHPRKSRAPAHTRAVRGCGRATHTTSRRLRYSEVSANSVGGGNHSALSATMHRPTRSLHVVDA